MMPPKILIVTDSHKLYRAIEINLEDHWEAISCQLPETRTNPPLPVSITQVDLIVLALSASRSEPIVWLSRAALQMYLGMIPLLIISDRGFKEDLLENIYHLDFPFDAEMLRHTVSRILFRTAPALGEPT